MICLHPTKWHAESRNARSLAPSQKNKFYPLHWLWRTLWLVNMREDCCQIYLYTTIPSVVEFNAWSKTSTISNQENGREVILVIRGVGQLQECPFDFYTGFVDGDKIREDLHFCSSLAAGAKTRDLFEILTHRLDKVRWCQYRWPSLYVRLLWRIAGTRTKKSA